MFNPMHLMSTTMSGCNTPYKRTEEKLKTVKNNKSYNREDLQKVLHYLPEILQYKYK